MTTKLSDLIKWLWIGLVLVGLANLVWADDGKSVQVAPLNTITFDQFVHIWSDQKWFQLEMDENKRGEVSYRGRQLLKDDGRILSWDTVDTNQEIITGILSGGGFPDEDCDMGDIANNGSGGCWYYAGKYSNATGLNSKKADRRCC